MYKLCLEKYPSGKYGFVGNIPKELCELKKNNIGQTFLASKVYNTRKEAENDKAKSFLMELDTIEMIALQQDINKMGNENKYTKEYAEMVNEELSCRSNLKNL